jgi:KaiC/GvpD/RAD55 family RecA-like ATPase
MLKSMIIQSSPLRILDSTLGGGLGVGNLGLISSVHGLGKTAALVHIAIDQMFQGRHVLHVTYHKKPDSTISYYEEIFHEISRAKQLEGSIEVHEEIIRNRSIMNLETYDLEHLLEGLELRINQGGFSIDTLIIEEFDFEKAGADSADRLKEIAKKKNLEIWVSYSFSKEHSHDELTPYLHAFDVVMTLRASGKHIHLELEKAHGRPIQDPHLLLDPKTLLIVKE